MIYQQNWIRGGIGLAAIALMGVSLIAYLSLQGIRLGGSLEAVMSWILFGNCIIQTLLAIAYFQLSSQLSRQPDGSRQENMKQIDPLIGNYTQENFSLKLPTFSLKKPTRLTRIKPQGFGRKTRIYPAKIHPQGPSDRERELEAIVAAALDAIAIADDQGYYVEVNPAALTLFGLPREELLGKRIADFMEPNFDFHQAWSTFLESGQSTGELALHRPDGTGRVVEYAARSQVVPGRHLSILRDITHRKQAEMALSESEEHLRVALEAARMGTWDWNIPTGEVRWSTHLEQLYGLTPGSFGGRYESWMNCIHPLDRDRVQEAVRESLNGAQNYAVEFRVLWPTGDIRISASKGQVFYDAQGEPVRMSGVDLDITEQYQAREALAQSQHLLAQIADTIPNHLYIYDLVNHCNLYTNRQMQQFFSCTPGELGGEGSPLLPNRFDPEESHHRMDLSERFRNLGDGDILENEFRLKNPQGEWRWFRTWEIIFRRTPEGKPAQVLGTAIDMTARKAAEQALLDERNFVSAVLDTAGAFVFVLDRQGRIVSLNRAGERVTGYGLQEVKGRYFWGFLGSPDEAESVQSAFEQLLKGHYPQAYETAWVGGDQTVRAIAWSNTVLLDSEGGFKYAIATGIDITQGKRAESIRRALEREQELSQLQIRFFSRVSHEFRTPLSTILMSAQILQNGPDRPVDSKNLRNLQRIQTSVKQMLHLLDDILIINRADTGRLEFNPLPLDVEQFCDRCIQDIQRNLGSDRAISFVRQPSSVSLPPVCVDEILLNSILNNLLSNALKYSTQESAIDLDLKWEPTQAIFQIRDRGIGIDPNERQQIFEPFYRGQNVGNIPGSGLGLTVVKRCVEVHQGAIAIESQLGLGSTFTICIPLQPPPTGWHHLKSN